MENYPFKWKLEADRLEIKIRLSIFTIISVCAGLPALVWSVSDLIHQRKNGHRISVFIILLLLTDINELLLSPYILLKHLLDEIPSNKNWTCWVFWSLWWSLRVCGLLLSQLVALDGIISVKCPQYTASVFSSNYIIIFYIIAFLCIIIGQIFLHSMYYVLLAVLVLFVSVVTWAISCGASSSAKCYSHTSRKPDRHILFFFHILSAGALFAIYGTPFLFILCSTFKAFSSLVYSLFTEQYETDFRSSSVCVGLQTESQNSNITYVSRDEFSLRRFGKTGCL